MSQKRAEVVTAAINGDADEIKAIVRKIVDGKEESGRTALMQAAFHSHTKVLEQLLVFGAVPDIGDKKQNTALHEACEGGCVDPVKVLLEFGANINARNNDGDSPLHLAAYGCNHDVVKLLLNEGADISMKNKLGQTPKEKLSSGEKAMRYDDKEAESILEVLNEWKGDKPVKSKKLDKTQKEVNIDSLKEIKQNVTEMSLGVKTLMEKIDTLGEELKVTTKKLAVSEQKASQYEMQLKQLKEGVAVMNDSLEKNGENASKQLTKLIEVTENIFDNLCQATDFNDRVYHNIFHRIAVAVSAKQDLWQDFAKNLFEGYPPAFVRDQINQIMAAYKTEQDRAYECLMRWKVIVATWVHKIGPLKSVISKTDIDGKEKLCEEIDQIVAEHTARSNETPKGSLSDKGLMVIAKQLGLEWRNFGVQLDFTIAQLDNFRDSYPSSDDRNHRMLVEWVRREDGFNDVKLGRLVEALKNVGRNDLAQTLTL